MTSELDFLARHQYVKAAEVAARREAVLSPKVPAGFGKFQTYFGDAGNALLDKVAKDGKLDVELGKPIYPDNLAGPGGRLPDGARSMTSVRFGKGEVKVSEEQNPQLGAFARLDYKGPDGPKTILAKRAADGSWRTFQKTSDPRRAELLSPSMSIEVDADDPEEG